MLYVNVRVYAALAQRRAEKPLHVVDDVRCNVVTICVTHVGVTLVRGSSQQLVTDGSVHDPTGSACEREILLENVINQV